jgi:PBP1b-binding outer membrane lipoprotein LpoB
VKLVLKIAAGVVLASILLIAGCAALVSAGANEVQKESDETAITHAQFKGVEKGATRADVEADLGEPSDVQETDVSAFETSTSFDCIYYNKKGELLSLYQFCFDDGKLTSKASY